MKVSGRLTAAITLLTSFEARRAPLKICLSDWGRQNRYAGAADRAFVSGLVKDALRHHASLAWRMGMSNPRAIILATLRFAWRWEVEEIAAAAQETPYGPGALDEEELARLKVPHRLGEAPAHVQGNYPQWLAASFDHGFGARAAREGLALCHRAPIDLRVNQLKSNVQKALKATATLGAEVSPVCAGALRVPALPPAAKAPKIEALPAYAKGFVEIQDLGSQIAALATGAGPGEQVLDLCAGGGGKTLALAAMMENKGQIFAYDADAARLAPLFDRLKKAGIRNTQIRSPAAGEGLDDLTRRMDLVLLDAPCSGSGTWRRHPDSKWRLTPAHLERRVAEQRALLDQGIGYVKPGGRVVYVTCSVLHEENEAQIEAFLARHPMMVAEDTYATLIARPEVLPAARQSLARAKTGFGALRLTPSIASTDGFFIATLRLSSAPPQD